MEDSESERLNSWKEIAAHLGVSVRTAERWEKTEQLPARRHKHAALSSVFAYRSELDAWWDQRRNLREPPPDPASVPPSVTVLPLANLDADEQNVIRSNGLTEQPLDDSWTARAVRSLNRLWDAIGDSAGTPRFIAKLPLRGYRSRASVEATSDSGALQAPAVPLEAHPACWHMRLRAAWPVIPAVILVAVGGWAWRYGLRTGAPHPRLAVLTAALGQEMMPTFSPDGRQVAFLWWREGEETPSLFVKLIGGGEPLRLTGGKPLGSPTWSPDGRYIAFQGSPPGFYLIPALGGSERRLAGSVLGPPARIGWFQFPETRRMDWFSDGKHLAVFDANVKRSSETLSELSIETGELRDLPHAGRCPRVSPDGKTLGFVSIEFGGPAIYLMPTSGGDPRRLTKLEERARDFAWTPDSREIVYTANPDGFTALWRIAAAGGPAQRVTAAGYDLGEPAIAHSGNRMAFTHWTKTQNIWRMDLDRLGPPRKLAATVRRQADAQFSPDGKRLAFISDRTGWPEVWTSDADGGNLMQVTSIGSMTVPPGAPRWAPDGREIVFHAGPQDRVDVFVVDAQGGAPRRVIASAPGSHWTPSFSREGRFIYLASDYVPPAGWRDRQIWKVPRSGGDAVQVTRQGGFAPMESPDGKYLYYFNDRKPAGLWRTPTGGGPETRVLERSAPINSWSWWTITDRGIVYLDDLDATGQLAVWPLKLFETPTRAATTFATMPKAPVTYRPGFTVSPDGHTIVYWVWDQVTSNIMLLENFR
ncbi:MAG: hypothetical protein LAQ69_21125 [Acidobacteriia bacterium]|nr:hypothetical protein [Terriglobia bacterium]